MSIYYYIQQIVDFLKSLKKMKVSNVLLFKVLLLFTYLTMKLNAFFNKFSPQLQL